MEDIEIARNTKLEDINVIARKLNVEDDIEQYGKHKAKISLEVMKKLKSKKNGKLILMTAINPTPLGEGKTTMAIGLADGMNKIGKNAVLALREPSLGPVFGIKGGATGGGHSQIAPMEDINLHFTGDIHAITAANNLLSAIIDNHIYFGNELNIEKVVWKRCLDLNDRQLRKVNTGLSGEKNIVPREDGFDISVASEIMAILCLATDIKDLKRRIGNIIIGYNKLGMPITAKDLKADGALTVLLKEAIKPNLVQSLEKTPAIVHGGPFANIAHGCNSIIATKMALKLADYVVTEAGFGADLGAEKFLDIKCRKAELKPDVVVCVATMKALKYHGGVAKEEVQNENIVALERGINNLFKHIDNLQNVYGLNVIVAINKYTYDTEKEINYLKEKLQEKGIEPLAYKLFCYSAHYRTKLNFTFDGAIASQKALNRLREGYLKHLNGNNEISQKNIEEYENKFLETINDDLNIPAAIGIIWDIVRSDKKSKQYAKLLEKFDEVLGLDIKNSEKYLEEQKNIELPEEIEKLVEERKQARLEKNWALSDEIRNKLIENGYQVEDSKDGMTVKKM